MSGEGLSNVVVLQAPIENEGQVHPLLIDHVLDKIFGYVADDYDTELDDTEEDAAATARICNLRLVCKLWKERATALLRKRYPTQEFGQHWINYYMDIREQSTLKLQKFVDIMRESDMIPYTSYSFREDIFSLQSSQLFEEFMGITSCSALELEINIDVSEVGGLRPTPNWNENLKMEKLQKLKIYLDVPEDLIIPKKCEISYFVGFLLASAPAIEEFIYYTSYVRKFDDGLDYTLEKIPKSVKKLDIQVHHRISNLHWNALLSADLKLEYFEIYSEDLDCDTYNEFFICQAGTLTDLCLWNRTSHFLTTEFPRMDKLKNLSVSGEILSSPTSISIVDAFPVVTRLDLECLKVGFSKLLECNRLVPSVQELLLPRWLPNLQCIKEAKKCFPNLKSLGVNQGLTDNLLEDVFIHFSKIEELTIKFNGTWKGNENINLSSLLSGVPKSVCEDITQGGNYSEVILGEIQTKPSILCLTKLKSLNIITSSPTNSVTDFLAHHLFLKMASLEELSVGTSHLSEQNIEALIAKLNKFVARYQRGRHGYYRLLHQR